MIEIEMSKDVREFEPKIILFFTSRQLICVAIGCAYAFPIAMLAPFDTMTKIPLFLILAAPALVCGWVKMYDMYFDKYFLNILLPAFLNPQKRPYKTKNLYEEEKEPQKKKKKIIYRSQYRPIK